MFGFSTLNLALIAGLVLAIGSGCVVGYEAIGHAAVRKIELQERIAVAKADKDQYDRNVAALQQSAADAEIRAEHLSQIKEALHGVPSSTVCLSSPAGVAFMRVMRQQRGDPGTSPAATGGTMAMPSPAAPSR